MKIDLHLNKKRVTLVLSFKNTKSYQSMRTKIRYPFIFLMIIAISIIASCKKDPIGSVSGVVTIYESSTPAVKTPLAGVKLFLVNTDFKLDSVDYANNKGAIVDSTVTGADGKYQIAAIPNGNWAIVPIPDTIMYRFELESSADSVRFTINKESFVSKVDFTTAVPVASDNGFHIRITSINRPNGYWFSVYRPLFLFNIIPSLRRIRINNIVLFTSDDMTMDLHFGIFEFLYAVSNNFVVKAHDSAGFPVESYWITFDYFNTPANSHWQIDWSAQTITRID